MSIWRAIPSPLDADGYAVARVVPLVNGDARVEHVHPIGFADAREAHRAASRLNARDSSPTWETS